MFKMMNQNNKSKNLKDDLGYCENISNEKAEEQFQGNAKNVLGSVIRFVKYENLNPNDKGENSKTLNMYLYNKKIDKTDFLIALQNKDGNGPQVSLRKKLRLYMLLVPKELVPKEGREFLDMFRLMNHWNHEFQENNFLKLKNTDLENISEVRNFTQHDQYIEFFKGLPNSEKTLRNLLLIPNFIIFWNMDSDKKDESSQEKNETSSKILIDNKTVDPYDQIIDDLFDQIKFGSDTQKYKQTIKNMHRIYVKSMNSSHEDNPSRCLATTLKDKDGNPIDVDETFSDFADMLYAKQLIDQNTCNRLKSGPNFLSLRLSVIWKYIKFFFRKNILRQKDIYYGYDSEILIKKINHFGNIFAPGWFNCDVDYYNKIKANDDNQDHVSNFIYTANQYFKNDGRSVLGQMLIQKGLKKAQKIKSPNFEKKEPQKLSFIQGIGFDENKDPNLFTPTTDAINKLISGQKPSEKDDKQ